MTSREAPLQAPSPELGARVRGRAMVEDHRLKHRVCLHVAPDGVAPGSASGSRKCSIWVHAVGFVRWELREAARGLASTWPVFHTAAAFLTAWVPQSRGRLCEDLHPSLSAPEFTSILLFLT